MANPKTFEEWWNAQRKKCKERGSCTVEESRFFMTPPPGPGNLLRILFDSGKRAGSEELIEQMEADLVAASPRSGEFEGGRHWLMRRARLLAGKAE